MRLWDVANALNASATIFEAMAEVDAKFAKYADKECDTVSGEVKKWFKKLAVSIPLQSNLLVSLYRVCRKRRGCMTRRSRPRTRGSNKLGKCTSVKRRRTLGTQPRSIPDTSISSAHSVLK